MKFYRSHVLVCVDPECLAKGAHELLDTLQDELVYQGLIDEIQVLETSRIGGCANGPEILVYPEGIHYAGMRVDDVPYLVEEQFLKGRVVERLLAERLTQAEDELGPPKPKEVRVVLRNCGQIDPENIEDYIAVDGYQALGKVLSQMTPEQVIEEIDLLDPEATLWPDKTLDGTRRGANVRLPLGGVPLEARKTLPIPE